MLKLKNELQQTLEEVKRLEKENSYLKNEIMSLRGREGTHLLNTFRAYGVVPLSLHSDRDSVIKGFRETWSHYGLVWPGDEMFTNVSYLDEQGFDTAFVGLLKKHYSSKCFGA